MARGQPRYVYYGSDSGMLLGPYTPDGIGDHMRARLILVQVHHASDIYRIEARSEQDAQSRLAAQIRKDKTSA
jgi:hypothetical protein